MQYKELKIVLMLKKDIMVKECGYILSKIISGAMSKNIELLKYHNESFFKLYSFDNLYPLAQNGLYIKGNLYNFRLRSIKDDFIKSLKRELYKFENEYAKIIIVDEKSIKQRTIEEVLSLTPIILSLKKDENSSLLDVEKLGNIQDDIICNLIKKYNSYYNTQISYEEVAHMFTTVKIASRPISVGYKGISLIGIKYRFKISKDSLSQKLAFFAEAVGLGEKSSACGAGFCHSVYDKVGSL